jgi:hypothetical protein
MVHVMGYGLCSCTACLLPLPLPLPLPLSLPPPLVSADLGLPDALV